MACQTSKLYISGQPFQLLASIFPVNKKSLGILKKTGIIGSILTLFIVDNWRIFTTGSFKELVRILLILGNTVLHFQLFLISLMHIFSAYKYLYSLRISSPINYPSTINS